MLDVKFFLKKKVKQNLISEFKVTIRSGLIL